MNASLHPQLSVESDGDVWLIRLNRPEKLNALTESLYKAFETELANLVPGSAHAIVLTGTGRAFCAGGDVEDLVPKITASATAAAEFARLASSVAIRVHSAPMPIVAAVNGLAFGAGAAIALASDLRIAAHTASFGFPFLRAGVNAADMGVTHLLPKVIGAGRAWELLLTGRTVEADEALRIGLVSEVVDDDRLLPRAMEVAHELAALPRVAMALTRRVLLNESALGFESAMLLEELAQLASSLSGESAAALDEFRAKKRTKSPDV